MSSGYLWRKTFWLQMETQNHLNIHALITFHWNTIGDERPFEGSVQCHHYFLLNTSAMEHTDVFLDSSMKEAVLCFDYDRLFYNFDLVLSISPRCLPLLTFFDLYLWPILLQRFIVPFKVSSSTGDCLRVMATLWWPWGGYCRPVIKSMNEGK